MSDNILEFYQIKKSSSSTICIKCVHFKNAEPNDKSRSEIWYNHLCLANPLPKKLNYVTGTEEYYVDTDTGRPAFTNQEYKYCKDVNDGKCPKYIEFIPTE